MTHLNPLYILNDFYWKNNYDCYLIMIIILCILHDLIGLHQLLHLHTHFILTDILLAIALFYKTIYTPAQCIIYFLFSPYARYLFFKCRQYSKPIRPNTQVPPT